MKKSMLSILLILCVHGVIQAQGNEQRGGGARGAEMMKQRLKDELKFSDVKTDSVAAIQMEFQMKNRELRADLTMSDDQKKAKMEQYNVERTARLKKILNDDELQKLEAYMENMRKMRQERQQ